MTQNMAVVYTVKMESLSKITMMVKSSLYFLNFDIEQAPSEFFVCPETITPTFHICFQMGQFNRISPFFNMK